MKNDPAYEKRLAAYLVIEFIIFCAVKIAEQTASARVESIFKYTPILLNLIVIGCIFFKARFDNRIGAKEPIQRWGIPLALLLTACADIFLVLIDRKEVLICGYLFFSLVQTVYAFYLGITPLIGAVRIAAYLSFLFFLERAGMLIPAYIVASWSMSQLIINVFQAWASYIKKRTLPSLLFAAGILLFLGCDGSIMIRNLSEEHTSVFYHVICLLVWTCYIPSQAAIVTSYVTDLHGSSS